MAADERLSWFPCDPKALLGAMSGMPSPKQLVYVIVLLRIYENGGACPDTVPTLAMRTRYNRRVVSDALNELFQEGRLHQGDGGIRNRKADEVIADSMALRERRQIASQKAGLSSAEKRQLKQRMEPTNRSTNVGQSSTPLPLQEQDSLFPRGNRPVEPKPKKPPTPLEIERKDLFDRGKTILGEGSGGFIQKLLGVKHGNIALARAAIEQASTMDNPREYIGGILRGGQNGKTTNALGGFSGLGARLRQAIADDEGPDFGESSAGVESHYRR
jgi:hypothetical protein